MTHRDRSGAILTGASAQAADKYQAALDAYYCYAGDPLTQLDEALADSPRFVMAHALKAYITLIGSNAETARVGLEAYGAALTLPASERERAHLGAIGCLIAGQIKAAGRILEDLTIAHPRDCLALQTGQLMDFLRGDSRMLRDRIGRAVAQWSPDMPDYHAVLGMWSFGLEETGHYSRAEAVGRQAIELQPRNGWARHAVAHVLEMQDRRAEGVAWFREDLQAWTDESFFQVHNWWHLALFHLGLRETEEALRLYDGPIWGAQSDMALDLVDAAAMLWRLDLRGAAIGDRWDRLADVYEAKLDKGSYAFDDAHAMMAFVGAKRPDSAEALLDLQAAAMTAPGDNAGFVRDVGLPLMEGLQAFGEGRYDLAIERLRGVRHQSARFGGSHAQRDLIDLTLIEAASRGRRHDLERALLAERANALPRVGGEGAALSRAA